MPKQKNLAELNAKKDKIEQQLAQERHKIHRLENRAAYYEEGDRRIGAWWRTLLFTRQTKRTAAFPIRTFMSCVPFALWTNTADGATSSGGNMCWTSMVSVFWMRWATTCSTLCRPPIGASRRRWKNGGRRGLICATRSLRRKVWIAGSTTAAMPVKALNRFLPITIIAIKAHTAQRPRQPTYSGMRMRSAFCRSARPIGTGEAPSAKPWSARLGNTWYTIETVCDGTEPLTAKVKRLIFSDREVAC